LNTSMCKFLNTHGNLSRNFLVVLLFHLLHNVSVAQVKFGHTDSLFNRFADTSRYTFSPTRPYFIHSGKEALPVSIKVIRQIDIQTSIIELTNGNAYDSLRRYLKITPANDLWKLSPYAERLIGKKDPKEMVFVLSGKDEDEILMKLQNSKQLRIVRVDPLSHSVLVKGISQEIYEQLLRSKEIIFIDLKVNPMLEAGIIGYNRSFHGLNAVDHSIPGANGKNIIAGVKEQKMDDADIDLFKRVVSSSIAHNNTSSHATVISSIIGGAGNSFYDGRGIAYGSAFFPSTFDNLFADDATVLSANKVTVQNHSYGTIIQQFYGAEAVSYDALAWANKIYVPVFSAGNRGTFSAGEGPYANIPGYANLTGNFKMAKNIITVGAINNNGSLPAETSAGPLYDGRLAPQITALGPNGTSDAAAIVSGTIAVMQQVYADSNGQILPPSSLVRATLYNTADDIYLNGLDYKTGYGLLNSFAAIRSIQRKEYDGSTISAGQEWIKNITVPPGAAQLKVTLAWTDSVASLNNIKALINDLDLEVIDLNGILYHPWVLNSIAHIDSLAKPATRKRDSLNTTEQVSISLPVPGIYQLKVKGTSIPSPSIVFNVSYHIDTLNTFQFTSPQHSSDVNRNEEPELYIRWRTFVSDTNQTGNLFISYDGGTNWQLIKAAHKIYSNEFLWSIKDTTSRAILKMETGFGNFFSKDFIIAQPLRPVLDFLCADSFGLSWPKHIYANSYRLFSLVDSPYLKHVLTIADTFLVLKRSNYPSLVYAIEPVLSNNIAATRSASINISQQGVKCFYKTFYHNLLDLNKIELVLELSTASYVDSIYFEQVTEAGSWIRDVGRAGVTAPNRLFNQIVNEAPPGISYWRARIKLESGDTLYTELISVLTSGRQFILFYPNPANRNTPLNYMLQQGTGSDSQLQFFDAMGRLIMNFSEMPGSIDISAFPPGIIIYKLYTVDGKVLESGKLVVQ
jgi:hypothetical protein